MCIYFRILLILLAVVLTSNFIYCFSNADICIRNKKECVLKSKSSLKCLNDECHYHKKLNYTCNQYCVTDQTACKNAELMTTFLKSYYNRLIGYQYLIKLISFEKSIQKCSSNFQEWKANDFCSNRKTCSVMRIVRMRSWALKLLEKKTCSCTGKFKATCSNQTCAINEKACNALKHASFYKMKAIKLC